MKVTLAKEAGFCFGVRRALDIARKEGSGSVVFGDLIHNKQEVNKLNEEGITIQKDIAQIKDKTTIITAHGIANSVKQTLKNNTTKLIDATCPLVTAVHIIAKDFENKGLHVVAIGKKDHIEVKGFTTDLKNKTIVEKEEDFHMIPKDKPLGLITQTTLQVKETEQLVNKIKQQFNVVEYKDTICKPTKDHQQGAEELAKQADIMIVIGGYHSGNTISLHKLCQKYTESYHIETKADLKSEWFKDKTHIGVTAGASTPDWIINEVIQELKTY